MKIKDKRGLTDALWLEWQTSEKEARKNCFIYQYIKEKMDTRADDITQEEKTVTLLGCLDGSTAKESLDKYGKYALMKAARDASDIDILTREQYGKIYWNLCDNYWTSKKTEEIDKKRGKRKSMDPPDKKEAKKTEERLLVRQIGNYFRNEGYINPKEELPDGKTETFTKGSMKKDKSRAYIDPVEMLNAYLVYKNEDLEEQRTDSMPANGLDAGSVKKYSDLLDSLNSPTKVDQGKAFMPLYFDTASGAGLYIIGRDHLKEKEQPNEKKACYACNVYFDYFMPDDYDFLMIVEPHTSIQDAVKDFGNAVGKGANNYREENGAIMVDGISDEFSRLFPEPLETKEPTKPTKGEKKIMDDFVATEDEAIKEERKRKNGKNRSRS